MTDGQILPFLINGLSVEMLADALREYGCCAQIDDPDRHRGPRIISGVQGWKFLVHPLGASVGNKFGRWRFLVGFNSGRPCSLETANEFNRAFEFGKFFVDSDGDANLEWIWDFRGGVSPAYLPQALKHWEEAVSSFQRYLCTSASNTKS